MLYKYYIVGNKYLISNNLQSEYSFIEVNKYMPPFLFSVDNKIENIWSKIKDRTDIKIEVIREKYLEVGTTKIDSPISSLDWE
jgi:hypothetical protein